MSDLIFASFRLATPLAFAALAGLLCERSGIVNLALEGFLLLGAFVAASTAALTNSMPVTWLAVSGIGLLLAFVFAFLTVVLRSSQVIIATALNLFVFGIIPLTSKLLFNSTGSTPVLPIEMRMEAFPVYLATALAICIYLYGKFSIYGLYWRTAGESAASLDAAGVSVTKIRFLHVLVSGIVASWGGASLSLFLSSSYSPMMAGGRGFIALAALILGRWNAMGVLISCILFGFFEALQMRLQGIENLNIPSQFVQTLPYVLTILILLVFKNQKSAPRELSQG